VSKRPWLLGALVAAAALLLGGGMARAGVRGPTPAGKLTLTGTFRDGSTLKATGVTWTPVPGSLQSVSYSWSACTPSACGVLSSAVHQPYLASTGLGPGDVGKRIAVRETATDVNPDGTTSRASVSYRSGASVGAWPAGAAPRVNFVYGVPDSRTASTRERFEFSRPHANAADGKVRIACAIDSSAYSSACGASRSYLTPLLGPGRHTLRVRVADAAGATTLADSWTVVPLPPPAACTACFLPPHLDATGHPMSWDWQLQGALVFRRVDMFDIDGFDNSTGVVASIHARASVRPLAGYPDEHWVDVRRLSGLAPVIDARLQMCASKGFDGVEIDNIDGWDNPSGFPLTPEDAEAWLASVANEAHALKLFVLWKNDPYLASFGKRYFDGALSEQCFTFEECTAAQNDGTTFFPGLTCNTTTNPCGVAQFASAGKWVGEVEYKWGVPGEDGVVCDPAQHCTLRASGGTYSEVPYATFCSHVYTADGFAAWRPFESDALDGSHSFYCWSS
jgi:hypothetical protein